MQSKIFIVLAAAVALSGMASAAEIKVLSTQATSEAYGELGACLRIRCFRRLESDSIPGHEQDLSRLEPGSGSAAATLGA
jgi:hypothetical protein